MNMMKHVMKPAATLSLIGLAFCFSTAGAVSAEEILAATTGSEVKTVEQRLSDLEKSMVGKDKAWADRVALSGVVEFEAGYAHVDDDDPATADEKTSDADLSAVELAVDAKIADGISAHALFKYEDDDVFLDEGFISYEGPENFPIFVTAGRMVVPFGMFETSFITDPMTLELGETSEGALVLGYRCLEGKVETAVSLFNGKTDEAGDDDTLSDMTARVTVAPMEGLSFGVSWTSNLAAADGLADARGIDPVSSDLIDPAEKVSGVSAYLTAVLLELVKISGEYTAALDDFNAGELYDAADTEKRSPKAWNIELRCTLTDKINAALRYAGSDDGDAGSGEFLAETQIGAVLNVEPFENTSFALEYLNSSYKGDFQTVDVVTAKVAVAF